MKQGDTIFSGQVLGEIQSDERIIEVLKEEDFDGIVEGQKVGVTVFTFGNEVFEGVVKVKQMSIQRQDAEIVC